MYRERKCKRIERWTIDRCDNKWQRPFCVSIRVKGATLVRCVCVWCVCFGSINIWPTHTSNVLFSSEAMDFGYIPRKNMKAIRFISINRTLLSRKAYINEIFIVSTRACLARIFLFSFLWNVWNVEREQFFYWILDLQILIARKSIKFEIVVA